MSEFFDGPTEGEVEVEFSDGVKKKLPVSGHEGLAVYQGDIVLGKLVDVLGVAVPLVRMGIGRTGAQFRWAGRRVPFEVDPAIHNPGRVEAAVRHWSHSTGINFVAITPQNRHQFTDFVSFQDQGGCWSYVGRTGGRQVVSLGPACPVGSVIHEIGHAVGLWHEQSRGDRDRWITIHWDAIKTSARRNFEQHTEDGRDLGSYDYGSIMHYPPNAFGINGRLTIEPTEPSAVIGQRDTLSEGDVRAVEELYEAA